MGKTFLLFGKNYEVTDARNNYFELRRICCSISEGVAEEYLMRFHDAIKGVSDISNKVMELASEVISIPVNSLLSVYLSRNYYNISADQISSQILKSEDFNTEYKKVLNSIYEIQRIASEEKYRRELRKENRMQWSAIGYGIGDSIKSGISAGVMNIGSGIVHDAVNSIGNSHTDSVKAQRLKCLYSSNETVMGLAMGLERAVRNYFVTMGATLQDNMGFKVHWIYRSDVQEANTIFRNVENPVLTEDQRRDILFKTLSLDPTNPVFYDYIFRNYGIEEKRAVCGIADYCMIDIDVTVSRYIIDKVGIDPNRKEYNIDEIRSIKKSITDVLSELGITKSTLLSEAETLEYQITINSFSEIVENSRNADELCEIKNKMIGSILVLNDKNDFSDIIDEKITELKTYDGILFDTQSEAERHSRLDSEVSEEIINIKDTASLPQVKERIASLGLVPQIADKLMTKCIEKDKALRTYKGILFDTQDEAVRNESVYNELSSEISAAQEVSKIFEINERISSAALNSVISDELSKMSLDRRIEIEKRIISSIMPDDIFGTETEKLLAAEEKIKSLGLVKELEDDALFKLNDAKTFRQYLRQIKCYDAVFRDAHHAVLECRYYLDKLNGREDSVLYQKTMEFLMNNLSASMKKDFINPCCASVSSAEKAFKAMGIGSKITICSPSCQPDDPKFSGIKINKYELPFFRYSIGSESDLLFTTANLYCKTKKNFSVFDLSGNIDVTETVSFPGGNVEISQDNNKNSLFFLTKKTVLSVKENLSRVISEAKKYAVNVNSNTHILKIYDIYLDIIMSHEKDEEFFKKAVESGSKLGRLSLDTDEESLNLIREFEKEKIEYNGAVYDSSEDALKAKDEYNRAREQFMNTNRDDIQSIQNSIDALKEYSTEAAGEFTGILTSRRKELDEQSRTVDGILYPNREEASKAEEEFASITEIMNGVNKNDEESVRNALSAISGKNTALSDKYTEKLNRMLVSYDVEYRTYNGKVVETRDQADTLRNEEEMIKEIMTNVSPKDESSMLEAVGKLEDMSTELKDEPLKKVKAMLEDYDRKLRTFEKHEYPTREEAVEARNAFDKMNEIMNGINAKDEQEVLRARDEIKSMRFDELKDPHLKKIDKILEKLDIEARTFEKNVYSTREDAANAKDTKEKFVQMTETLDFLDPNNLSILEKFISNDMNEKLRPEASKYYTELSAAINEMNSIIDSNSKIDSNDKKACSEIYKQAEKTAGKLKKYHVNADKLEEIKKQHYSSLNAGQKFFGFFKKK